MYARLALSLALVVSILACSGGPEEADVSTPSPPPPVEVPVAPPPEPAVEEVIAEEVAPAGGWIQDEVIYDAEGKVYGCVGGGNWCGNSPPRDPVTRKPLP
ncbi:MAG: hypothetical protein V4850_01070 [Myxococcota bacterium]